MQRFKFKKIDAFATGKSGGNPAGYIHLNSKNDIDPRGMLKIAQEMSGFVNEVGYVYQSEENEFDLKFYSSLREVDFCGHATIAIMYDLVVGNKELSGFETLKITTNKGPLIVENRVDAEDAVFIMSPAPVKRADVPTSADLARALKIQVSDINSELSIEIINAGLNTLIVPIRSLETILSITPDLTELNSFCRHAEIDIIEVFTDKTSGDASDYRVRVFAPTFGYLEDPATGSGNSALGYYLREHNVWTSETLLIEQNAELSAYNLIKLKIKKNSNGTERVWFGGSAITRIEGNYLLH